MDDSIVKIKFELFTYYDEYLSKKDAATPPEPSRFAVYREEWKPGTPWVKDDWDIYLIGLAKVYVNDVYVGKRFEDDTNALETAAAVGCNELADKMKLSESTIASIFDQLLQWMEDSKDNYIWNGVIEFDLNLATEEISNITGEGSATMLDQSEFNESKVLQSFSIPLFEEFNVDLLNIKFIFHVIPDDIDIYDNMVYEGTGKVFINDVLTFSFDTEETADSDFNQGSTITNPDTWLYYAIFLLAENFKVSEDILFDDINTNWSTLRSKEITDDKFEFKFDLVTGRASDIVNTKIRKDVNENKIQLFEDFVEEDYVVRVKIIYTPDYSKERDFRIDGKIYVNDSLVHDAQIYRGGTYNPNSNYAYMTVTNTMSILGKYFKMEDDIATAMSDSIVEHLLMEGTLEFDLSLGTGRVSNIVSKIIK